jgi:hypothetical protein
MSDLILSYIKKIQEDVELMRKDHHEQLNRLETTVEELQSEIRANATRMLRLQRRINEQRR